jgi:hypothetical protein
MCRGAFASGRIARVGCAILDRPVSPAARLDDAFHRASAKTGWVGAIRRRADHQEENLRAARPLRALPPLFGSVLHERDLRSSQRAASMHRFVACALTVPGGSSDRGVCVHRNSSLPIIWLSVNSLLQKRCSPLTITTGPRAVGFHPKFPVWCGGGVRPVSVRLQAPFLTPWGTSSAAKHAGWNSVLAGKTPGFRRRLELRIDIHFNVIFRSY